MVINRSSQTVWQLIVVMFQYNSHKGVGNEDQKGTLYSDNVFLCFISVSGCI